MTQKQTAADEHEIVVTLRLRFKPGTTSETLDKILPTVTRTREEPGNIEFSVYRARDDDDLLILFERWKNQAALEQHWQMDYTKEAMSVFEQNLLKPLSEEDDVTYLRDIMPVAR